MHDVYRFMCEVKLMVNTNPSPKYIQQIRLKYHAEALIVHHFGAAHKRVRDFIASLGFTVTEEKVSRVDLQVLIDIPVSDFSSLIGVYPLPEREYVL